MNDLNIKIKNTALFSQDEKIEILAAVDTFSEGDKAQLADIIDEYDKKFIDITNTFKQHMIDELCTIEKSNTSIDTKQMKDAVEKIKLGLNMIIASKS